jgi:hypothetical protein
MAIPTHHEAMLTALGLQGLDHLELSARTTAGDEHNSVAVAVAAVHLITVKRRDASVRLAASSSAEPQESQDLVVPGLTDTGLALPLARLLVEALLLAPADVELCGGALRMLLLALQAHHAVTTAESGRYAADAELLRDVLLLAAPSVLHTLAEARASGAADILTASDAEKAEHMDSLATLVMRLTMSGESIGSNKCQLVAAVVALDSVHYPRWWLVSTHAGLCPSVGVKLSCNSVVGGMLQVMRSAWWRPSCSSQAWWGRCLRQCCADWQHHSSSSS